MARAIELAKLGSGFVSPNPLVGCFIVKDGRVIGEGWHEQYGQAHAEVRAFESCTESARGATLYCTLEPCSHVGKTPPCAHRIVNEGIAQVVIANRDPNPLVNGSGVEYLRQHGIEVVEGILADEAAWMNRFFLHAIAARRPYTIVKVAQSVDACIVSGQAENPWITSEASLTRVHQLRSQIDAVCVGADTVIADNPKLNVRHVAGRNPLRVVIDSKLRTPLDSHVYSDELRLKTIVFCVEDNQSKPQMERLKERGVVVHVVAADAQGHCRLDLVHDVLFNKHNCTSLMVESGSALASALLRQSLVQELQIFIAPRILGSDRHSFSAKSEIASRINTQFNMVSVEKLSDDLLLTMRVTG